LNSVWEAAVAASEKAEQFGEKNLTDNMEGNISGSYREQKLAFVVTEYFLKTTELGSHFVLHKIYKLRTNYVFFYIAGQIIIHTCTTNSPEKKPIFISFKGFWINSDLINFFIIKLTKSTTNVTHLFKCWYGS